MKTLMINFPDALSFVTLVGLKDLNVGLKLTQCHISVTIKNLFFFFGGHQT